MHRRTFVATVLASSLFPAGQIASKNKAGADHSSLPVVSNTSYRVAIEDFGGGPDKSAAKNSDAIYAAQQSLLLRSGGTIVFGEGIYEVEDGRYVDWFENSYSEKKGSDAAILVMPGISMVGQGAGRTIIRPINPEKCSLIIVSPEGGEFRGFTYDGGWDGVATRGGTLLLNMVPSDVFMPHTLDSQFTRDLDGWDVFPSDGGMVATPNGTGRAVITFQNTYDRTVNPHIFKSFATEIGRNYRVKFQIPNATVKNPEYLRLSISSTSSLHDVFFSEFIGFPVSTRNAKVVNFVAQSSETTIFFDHAPPVPVATKNAQFELNFVRVTDFPIEDQKRYVNNTIFEDLHLKNSYSYGLALQDGDFRNVRVDNLRITNTGGDGLDFKQRGPSADNYGLSVTNLLLEDVCRVHNGVAGLDLRGDINVSNIQIRGFGSDGKTSTGIRFRTSSPDVVRYGGDSARGSSVTGFFVYNGLGNASGISVGSSNVSVSNGFIENCTDGVRLGGNSFGEVELASLFGVTASFCDIGFMVAGQWTRLVACSATDCDTGFLNRGKDNEYHGCLAVRTKDAFIEKGSGTTNRIGGNI